MSDIILLMLWAVQQWNGILYAAVLTLEWAWMSAEAEVCRAVRVAGEMRRDQGRIDDGVWAVQRVCGACALFCAGMAWWSIAGALSSFHSILWAVPTLILIAGFFGYMLAGTRGAVDQLRERKMWLTATRWADDVDGSS